MTVAGTEANTVWFDHCAQFGGAEVALLRVLQTPGRHRDTVVLGEFGPLGAALNRAGIRVVVRPLPPSGRGMHRGRVLSWLRALPALLVYVARLALWLRRERPGVVHLNSLRGALIAGPAARLAGIPTVWHAHDSVDPSYLPRSAVRLVRVAVRLVASAVVANSRWTLSTLRLQLFDRPVAVVPPPLPSLLEPLSRSRNRAVGLLMAGRLAPWKGQADVLHALSRLDRGLPWRMTFVGSALFGEHRYADGLEKLAADLGLADRIRWVPFTEDVRPHYRAADVLVHYSRSPEPFGMVVTEGMAHGLAVVAAAAGGPAETVQDGATGLLVPPRRPHDLALALDTLIRDPDLRARLGAAAAVDLDRYAPDVVAAALTRVHDAVRRRPRPR